MLFIRLLTACSVLLNFDLSFSQGVWTQKANFPAGGREEAIGFNVGMKGYFGMGTEILGPRHNDMWEYDPVLNTWTPKDSMPGQRRWGAFSFAIGNMGYVGTGFGSSPYLQDFWEYNTQNNTWMQKANFGGPGRYSAFGISIGNKGYAGTGYTSSGYAQDFYEYDPVLNTWALKAPFGGGPRQHAAGFTIGNMGYAGTGTNGTVLADFWKYDPALNTWSLLSPFPGGGRLSPAVFVIGNDGYMGTGWNSTQGAIDDFYKYDPLPGTWSPIANFPTVREGANFVSIGQKGYVGNGNTGLGPNYQVDWWEYSPDSILTAGPDPEQNIVSCTVYPNPVTDHLSFVINSGGTSLTGNSEIKIYNLQGNLVSRDNTCLNTTRFDLHEIPSGVYFFSVSHNGNYVSSGNFVVVPK